MLGSGCRVGSAKPVVIGSVGAPASMIGPPTAVAVAPDNSFALVTCGQKLDDFFQEGVEFGWYQGLIVFLLTVPACFLNAYNAFSMIFMIVALILSAALVLTLRVKRTNISSS